MSRHSKEYSLYSKKAIIEELRAYDVSIVNPSEYTKLDLWKKLQIIRKRYARYSQAQQRRENRARARGWF